MIWAYRDMLTSSHLREHTVTKSIWPCGQSDSAAHPPRLRGFERTDRTHRVEPTRLSRLEFDIGLVTVSGSDQRSTQQTRLAVHTNR